MPLNVPKSYSFVPTPIGPVRLMTRHSRRARMYAGGTFFRSKERGENQNQLELTVVEDLTFGNEQGVFIEHNRVFKPEEMISVDDVNNLELQLFELNLPWNQELRLMQVGASLVAQRYGISWQIGGSDTLLQTYGPIKFNQLLSIPGLVSLRLQAGEWLPGGVVYLRPRTHRYTLELLEITDPDTQNTLMGWNIEVLRATLNGSNAAWIRMPERPDFETQFGDHEDVTDDGFDAQFLSAFGPSFMSGGDGLPLAPVGFNTGPDRVLVHLNYSELASGAMGELNQVFEWVGESTTVGSWQRYA